MSSRHRRNKGRQVDDTLRRISVLKKRQRQTYNTRRSENAVKVPRPPNAFLVFSNEMRAGMAFLYPAETNKHISKRLGHAWKALGTQEKARYFEIAGLIKEEHTRKYPDYMYSPKEARARKVLRQQARPHARMTHAVTTGSASQPAAHQQWASANHHHDFQHGLTGAQGHSGQGLLSARMLADQQRISDRHAETYFEMDAIPYYDMNNHTREYAALAEIEGQQWLPYMQVPQAGTTYMRPHEETKLQQGGPWTQYTPETRTQQVPAYHLKQDMMNGSYGNCMPNQPIPGTSGSSQHASAVGEMVNHSDRGVGSNYESNTNNFPQHQYVYHHEQPTSNSALTRKVVTKDKIIVAERIQMLELLPASSKNTVALASTTTSSSSSTTVKPETTSTTYSAGNNQQQIIVRSSGSEAETSKQPSTVESTSLVCNSSNISSGEENTSGPLPAFEQAFGSTEIGRYSHEGFFSTTQQTENQPPTNSEVSVNNAPDYNYYMGPSQIPAFESTMHYHQNQLQTTNQYSGFYNYYNYNCNEYHQHFSYSHSQCSHLNPWASCPMKYENILNY